MKVIINEDIRESILNLIKTMGVNYAINMTGSLDTLLNVGFGGDLKEFYKYTEYVPYKLTSTGENMYIDNLLLESLNLEDSWDKKEKKLGDFRWTSGGMNYKFTAYLTEPFKGNGGQEFRRVIGTCGDHGFGYSFITKRNTIGKRGRNQIFKQIIEKYQLDSFF